MHRAT